MSCNTHSLGGKSIRVSSDKIVRAISAGPLGLVFTGHGVSAKVYTEGAWWLRLCPSVAPTSRFLHGFMSLGLNFAVQKVEKITCTVKAVPPPDILLPNHTASCDDCGHLEVYDWAYGIYNAKSVNYEGTVTINGIDYDFSGNLTF